MADYGSGEVSIDSFLLFAAELEITINVTMEWPINNT